MNEIEQAHKLLTDLLLNGQITLYGNPMSLGELSKLVTAERILYTQAANSVKTAESTKAPPQVGKKK